MDILYPSDSGTALEVIQRSGSSLAQPLAWPRAGSTTELSSQTVADPELGGPHPSPSRMELEPTCPTICGPVPAPALKPECGYAGAGRAYS
jgi:hypothetical protein